MMPLFIFSIGFILVILIPVAILIKEPDTDYSSYFYFFPDPEFKRGWDKLNVRDKNKIKYALYRSHCESLNQRNATKNITSSYICLLFGVHYFYLNEWGKGLLYWITGGGLGIWVLYSIFSLSNKVNANNIGSQIHDIENCFFPNFKLKQSILRKKKKEYSSLLIISKKSLSEDVKKTLDFDYVYEDVETLKSSEPLAETKENLFNKIRNESFSHLYVEGDLTSVQEIYGSSFKPDVVLLKNINNLLKEIH